VRELAIRIVERAKKRTRALIRKTAVTLLLVCLSWAFGAGGTEERPFRVTVHGNFKRMMHTGDTAAKVALASVPRAAGIYGVGALAALRGRS